ncbi:hypothetical protein QCN27_18800 [Cereibacter sp. SYSU M97828]|nr:hypothetical protein [Cereibacter flavus]
MVILLMLLLAFPAFAEDRLEIIAHPTSPRIVEGEMIPVTIRGTYDRKVALERLLVLPSDRFDWVQLEKDDWREERIDGRLRIVFERKLALFPRRTGIAAFGPVEHEMTVIGQGSRREEVTVVSHPLELTIAPMPLDPPFHPVNPWRFAARELTLTDQLSTRPDRLEDGQTVTRRVTLRAVGALPEMLPPRPVVSEGWLIAFAAPVERSLELTPDGPVATAIWTWQFRPETGEPGVLPPVVIPFFDTAARKVSSVTIPPLPIGYASFRSAEAVSGATSGWVSLLALVCGFGGGFFALMRGERRAGPILPILAARWSPLPTLRLHRAARRHDLLALRRAAEDWLDARPERNAAASSALAELDEAIYAERPLRHGFRKRLRG